MSVPIWEHDAIVQREIKYPLVSNERHVFSSLQQRSVPSYSFYLENMFCSIHRQSSIKKCLCCGFHVSFWFDKNCTTLEQCRRSPRVLLMNMSFTSMSNLVSCFLTSLLDDEWKATSFRSVVSNICRWKEVTSHWTDVIRWEKETWIYYLYFIETIDWGNMRQLSI